jgi:GNAT superfamily N-acetyltransferase
MSNFLQRLFGETQPRGYGNALDVMLHDIERAPIGASRVGQVQPQVTAPAPGGFDPVATTVPAPLARQGVTQGRADQIEAQAFDAAMNWATVTPMRHAAGPLNLSPGAGRQAQIGDTFVEYSVNPISRQVRIDSILTDGAARNKGSARAAMNAILRQADDAGFSASLIPWPDDPSVDVARLTRFYRRLGFKKNPRSEVMTRSAEQKARE